MTEFLTQHFEWVIGGLFLLVFLISFFRILKKVKRVDREGLTADGVVTRVEYVHDTDSHDTYITYVEFRDEKGETHESALGMTLNQEHQPGDRVRIRYIPGDFKYVRPVQ